LAEACAGALLDLPLLSADWRLTELHGRERTDLPRSEWAPIVGMG